MVRVPSEVTTREEYSALDSGPPPIFEDHMCPCLSMPDCPELLELLPPVLEPYPFRFMLSPALPFPDRPPSVPFFPFPSLPRPLAPLLSTAGSPFEPTQPI